jgi:DNA-binding response OmpR family regulator
MNQVASDPRPILVADDDPDIRTIVCLRLKHLGHAVMSAEDGNEALRLASSEAPKMCILDIVMGTTSGLDVVRELRARAETAEIPILLLSASVQEADVERGLELGANGYLQKPFRTRDLTERVSECLSGPLKEPTSTGQFQ